MTRLPILLSAVALVVAIVAAVGAFRDRPMPEPGLNEAAVSALIEEKVAAITKDAEEQEVAKTAEAPSAPELDAETVGPVVRDYMIAHPEILEDMLAALEDKRE